MEPMNQFLNTHRQEFKSFVDAICGISPDRATSAIPPSYATPITILSRLPGTSREGFPSLPYLIDQARECAGLVTLWLEARNEIDSSIPRSDELNRFDALCENSRRMTKDRLNLAEQADRPGGSMGPKWDDLVEQLERKATIKAKHGRATPGTPSGAESLRTDNSSRSSLVDGYVRESLEGQDSSSVDKPSAAGADRGDGFKTEDNEHVLENKTRLPPVSSSVVWDPGSNGVDEEPESARAVKDEDEDSVEQLVPDPLGSSMYSLSPNPSNKLAKSPRTSGHRRRHEKGARSTYSLNTHGASERSAGGGRSTPSGTSVRGQRDRDPTGSTGKSMYRLKEVSADTGGGRSSPVSRDGAVGILRVGDLGNLFKRKGRERDDVIWKG